MDWMAEVASTQTAAKPQSALPRESESAAERRKALPTGPCGTSSSLSQPPASAAVNSSHPRHCLLTHGHRGRDSFGEVDIDSRAESDESDPLGLYELGPRC